MSKLHKYESFSIHVLFQLTYFFIIYRAFFARNFPLVKLANGYIQDTRSVYRFGNIFSHTEKKSITKTLYAARAAEHGSIPPAHHKNPEDP